MIKKEKRKRDPLVVTVQFLESERKRFEDVMEQGCLLKGRWVAAAIREKLERDNPEKDEA